MLSLLLTLLAPQPSDLDRLQGEWLLQTADDGSARGGLMWHWNDRVTVAGRTVTLSKPDWPNHPSKTTTLRLDPAASPKRLDWQAPPPDDASFVGRLFAGGTTPAIYRFVGDAVEVCAAKFPTDPRPTAFAADMNRGHLLFTLRRWTGKPGGKFDAATVTVRDPAGQPIAGAVVRRRESEEVVGTTAADGTATVNPSDHLDFLAVTHPGRKLIGFASTTPAELHHGLTVTLAPTVRVTGRAAAPGLADGPGFWAQASVRPPDGRENARGFGLADPVIGADGRFTFDAPPGDYRLHVHAERLVTTTLPLTVPAGRDTLDLGDLPVKPSGWGEKVGTVAPELTDLDGWVGTPTTLAGLRGKVVLVHLWTHDDPPGQNDRLATFAEVAARGTVAVVGVHVTRRAYDGARPVRTPDEFAAVVGPAPPFPVALCRDCRWAIDLGLPAGAFGQAVVIDRSSRLRGLYAPGWPPAEALLAKVLAE